MGRAALSRDQVETFRAQVVAVAGRLFAQRGYEGVTLRAIAQELGCSAMTPYRYFRDKPGIFAAVRTAAFREFTRAQQQAAASSDDPAERLMAMGRAYVRFAIEHPDSFRLMFELSQPDPAGYDELQQAGRQAWQPLHDATVAALPEPGDANQLAHVFWAGMHGIASLHVANKFVHGIDADAIVDPMLTILFRGATAGLTKEQ